MIPLGFGFNENQRHQNCISQDASVTGFKRKVRNPGPEDHIRLHFFEPGLRTFLTYYLIISIVAVIHHSKVFPYNFFTLSHIQNFEIRMYNSNVYKFYWKFI